MPVPRAYEAASGLPAQAPLVPPREILPFAHAPAHQRTLREGGRQRERWPVPMPGTHRDSQRPRSGSAGGAACAGPAVAPGCGGCASW
jgi:hypothetical protein